MLNLRAIRKLVEEAPENVLSLLLNVDAADQANQADTPAWRIYAKNALREIESQIEESQLSEWQSQRQAAETFLETYSPNTKTLVLFVGAEDYLEKFALPIPLENQSAYGAPLLLPLLWAVDEYEACLVVLVDNEKAQFVHTYLGGASLGDRMRVNFEQYEYGSDRYVFRQSGGDATTHDNVKDAANAKVDALLYRFYNELVPRIEEEMQTIQAKRLILGGNELAAKQVQSLLSAKLSQEFVSVLPIPIDSSESQIVKAIEQATLTVERDDEAALVRQIIDAAKSGGRGALGKKELEQAFRNKQVELLVLPYPPNDKERAQEWLGEALRLGASVELVHGTAADQLLEEGEAAARLYYPLVPEN